MSERLRHRIVSRIRAHGPITWAEYMRLALYDPSDGFFSAHPVGRSAHFVTSPHVSGVFATLLARHLRDAWDALGRPVPFTAVEAGAGDGTLARQILAAASGDERFARALRYLAVEQSARARSLLAGVGVETFPSLARIEPFSGCVLANELLDNLPFHRLRRRDGMLCEIRVGVEGEDLVETDWQVSRAAVQLLQGDLAEGEERLVSPEIGYLVNDVARVLHDGYAFLVDYGFAPGEDAEPVRGYRAHRLVVDLLADPGSTDVTGPVDLGALARRARARGLQVWGPVSQRQALMSLGYRRVLDDMRGEQARAEATGDSRRAVELFGARGEASMLVDPAGLGGLRVITLGTPGVPEPRATRGT